MSTTEYTAWSLLLVGGWAAAGLGLGYVRFRLRQIRRRPR